MEIKMEHSEVYKHLITSQSETHFSRAKLPPLFRNSNYNLIKRRMASLNTGFPLVTKITF